MAKNEVKAVGLYQGLEIGHPEALLDLQLPVPTLGTDDLLVRIEAVSVNPADYRVRRRKEADGAVAVLGWDAVGKIVAAGAGVDSRFAVGDRVFYAGDVSRPGANSEFHVVDHRIVAHAPSSLTDHEAAAIPLTALTAWEALFERMGFPAPEFQIGAEQGVAGSGVGSVADDSSRTSAGSGKLRFKNLLIIGGAGGVGSMAIQLAKQVPGLQVIATASRPESRTWCQKFGADAVIDHSGPMGEQLAELGLQTVDAILLLNHPDIHFPGLAERVTPQGCICSIVPFENPPDMNLLMRKSITFIWEYMFTRSLFATPDRGQQQRILAEVAAGIDQGRLRTTETEHLGRINTTNLRTAHARLESGSGIGKITFSRF